MAYQNIVVEKANLIGTLTLNRPEKLNAMNPALLSDFEKAIGELEADAEVKVLVIRGAGRSFSAGYDLTRETEAETIGEDRSRLQANLDRWQKLRDLSKPVIAMVHGHCLAGATQMCIACDIIFVSEDANIGFPAIPAGAGLIGQMWTWLVGPSRAKYMSFLPGSALTGKEAEAFAWATRSFPPAKLEEETYSYAAKIAKVPGDLLRIKKLAVNRTMDLQGFRAASMFGAEWDAISHFTDGVKDVQQKIRELGLRGTIEWYKSQ
ncbi:enoyl-CoA hydratase-related protein [Dehalococcoidia bacterium]|nr:enoyl-CoA hydratase-related protein [Dehalococcoidia bacterium]